jgi:hypothetical protein
VSTVQDLYLDNLRRQGLVEETPAPIVQPLTRTVEKQQPTVPVKAVVREDRVTDLERRIKALEDLLRPALAEEPVAEIDRMYLEFLSLNGKTELTWHQYRTMPRIARKALLAGVDHE